MRRTTLVGGKDLPAEADPAQGSPCEPGSLKVFFSYAPLAGATAAMLDEASGLTASGRDVLVAGPADDGTTRTIDLDQVLARHPDVVVLENLAMPNAPGSRNRTRYQDAEELLRAGIDVFATLRVSDLENERARAVALGAAVPPESVPDHLIYDAAQLEFVDIDPAELVVRSRAHGIEAGVESLSGLRVLALRCVSDYASSAGAGARDRSGDDPRASSGPVVAVVGVGDAPRAVLLEARRVAASQCSEVVVVCVRPDDDASRPGSRDESYLLLEDQVEAMGFSLKTLYGEEPASVVADFLRSLGASDVVLAHRRVSFARRLLLPLSLTFEHRLAETLTGVDIHLVSDDAVAGALSTMRRAVRPLIAFRMRDLMLVAVCLLAAFGCVRLLQLVGFGDSAASLIFMASFVPVAFLTRNYVSSLIAVLCGSGLLDYFFMRSYQSFSIDHRATALSFGLFVVVALIVSFSLVRLARVADRADRRERRTQALYDLNNGLLYAHGVVEVAESALASVTRLFERSAAVMLADPFGPAPAPGSRDRRAPLVHAVEGDLEAEEFLKVTEKSIGHWVFSNGEVAGSGTSTHGESYIYYLPLVSEENVEGVLAVSDRRALTMGERSFLEMVATQLAFSLERQSLGSKHRADLATMRATDIRNEFVAGVVASLEVANDTEHALADALLSAPDDDGAYRDALVRVLSDESARARLMASRATDILAFPVDALCDVRKEVAAAVDEVREGLSGKVIDLKPSEAVPLIVADAALLRSAVKFILDASTAYIERDGVVEVSVASYPDRVNVVVADNRPTSVTARSTAFELSSRAGAEDDLCYDEVRARALRSVLLDRTALPSGDPQELCAALCRAVRLPEAVALAGDAFNRQRLLRFDRLEYGLYMAALAIRAHGGTISQRYRLGGGSVVTFSLPRN